MKLNDTDFNLQFPDPDWEIAIDLTGVKKVKYAENPLCQCDVRHLTSII
jgi:hypothetical protein